MSSRRINREEKIYQSLLYPGTEVFINKLDIRNPKWLEQAELVFYMERMRQPLPKAAQELNFYAMNVFPECLFYSKTDDAIILVY